MNTHTGLPVAQAANNTNPLDLLIGLCPSGAGRQANRLDALHDALDYARAATSPIARREWLERAEMLCEEYSDAGAICNCGYPFNEYGHCGACLERAELMTAARASVGRTELQRDEGVPF